MLFVVKTNLKKSRLWFYFSYFMYITVDTVNTYRATQNLYFILFLILIIYIFRALLLENYYPFDSDTNVV